MESLEKENIEFKNNNNNTYYIAKKKRNLIFKNYNMIFIIFLFILNIFIIFNLLIQKKQILDLNNNLKILLNLREHDMKEKNSKNNLYLHKKKNDNKNKDNNSIFNFEIDKDMVGLKYPEILYDKLKFDLTYKNITNFLIDFLEQLEIKLIYLEKEINVTKLISFFTNRNLYLEKNNIIYDDSNITELHNIISWLVIHKSTQLKGIASDKFLACKYVKLKLNKDLCEHRIRAYDKVEDINFEELVKIGDLILKISNGCHDLVYIRKNSTNNIEFIKQLVSYYYNREYSLIIPEFFHLYSKKRIIVEKIFIPFSDLYEFKFFIINRNIKFFQLVFCLNNKKYLNYYDNNYEILPFSKILNFTISSRFKRDLLEQLKDYAYKLSEDFQNFIRVDLYLFHNKIYLSELTFDSFSGKPMKRTEEIILETGKSWKLIE